MNENPAVDLSEKGRKNGQTISLDRRLFMQFLAFGGCNNAQSLQDALAKSGADAVLYADVHDAHGVGVLTLSEEPDFYIDTLRPLLQKAPFADLTPKPEMTMMGRTYTIGYEPDLEEALFTRPRTKVLNPDLRWVIWYPLRRSGSFEDLPADEQRDALKEHGGIGMAFGRSGLATDIRLACHGLDKHDNDFVIGLLGSELFPLSAVVQTMRKTVQTKRHLDRLGPFFAGRVIWQSTM